MVTSYKNHLIPPYGILHVFSLRDHPILRQNVIKSTFLIKWGIFESVVSVVITRVTRFLQNQTFPLPIIENTNSIAPRVEGLSVGTFLSFLSIFSPISVQINTIRCS